MNTKPPCYQADCENCPYRDSCRTYVKPPMPGWHVPMPGWPAPMPWWPYPNTGDPIPPCPYITCNT